MPQHLHPIAKRASLRARHAGLVALFLLPLAGCGAELEVTWEDLQQSLYREPDSGVTIVNGDEAIETEAELQAFFDRLQAEVSSLSEARPATLEHPLIVNRAAGGDDRWSSDKAQDLTYCVSQASFGARYREVVGALQDAAASWEGAARVQFVHDAARDSSCSRSSPTVFNVRQACSRRYLARSFFPSTSRAGRELVIDCTAFGDIDPVSLTGVERHELGHVLGFRHEHTRPEAGACFEDNSWRALTRYDSDSVMHYPQCNGSNAGDLVLTAADRAGAASLYP